LLLPFPCPTLTTKIKGRTALHIAVENKHPDIIQQLLEAKADIKIQDQEGNTPFKLAQMIGDHGNLQAFQQYFDAQPSGHLLANLEFEDSISIVFFPKVKEKKKKRSKIAEQKEKKSPTKAEQEQEQNQNKENNEKEEQKKLSRQYGGLNFANKPKKNKYREFQPFRLVFPSQLTFDELSQAVNKKCGAQMTIFEKLAKGHLFAITDDITLHSFLKEEKKIAKEGEKKKEEERTSKVLYLKVGGGERKEVRVKENMEKILWSIADHLHASFAQSFSSASSSITEQIQLCNSQILQLKQQSSSDSRSIRGSIRTLQKCIRD